MISLDPDALLRLRALVRAERGGNSVTALPGGMVVRASGRGLETADLRAFAHGDDPRHIDPNSTARTGHPQVRNFHAERDQATLLIADFRPSMLWGTRRTLRSVAAAEALCLAGWHTVVEGGRVGLIAITAQGPVFQRPAGCDRAMVAVIGAMVRAHDMALKRSQAPDPPLSEAMMYAQRIVLRGSDVLLATSMDNLGADFEEQARELGQRTRFSVLRIVDAFEVDPPKGAFRFSTASGRAGVATPRRLSVPPELKDMISTTWRADLAPDAQQPEKRGLHG